MTNEPFNRADDRRSSFSEGHVEILNQEDAGDKEKKQAELMPDKSRNSV